MSQVNFNKDSKDYKLTSLSASRTNEQKGHYELSNNSSIAESQAKDLNGSSSLILKDNGEKLIIYKFDDEKSNSSLNFAGLKLDSNYGTQIVDYNNKVSFVSLSVQRQETAKFIEALLSKIGNPTQTVQGELEQEDISKDAVVQLAKLFPSSVKHIKNDLGNDVTTYPEIIVWNKNDVLYQLTLNPTKEGITNSLVIISKKALKDKIIMGFHNAERDPILSKYIN